MKKIKEWVYLLFRPKWERRLYKLLKNASLDRNLNLDTVLYSYCPPEETEGKVFKAGIDAMFIGWLGLFDARVTAEKSYGLQAQEVMIELSPMPDGSVPEVATHELIHGKVTLREYLKQIAHYVVSDYFSESDRYYLKDLAGRDFLGLALCWQHRQKAVQDMLLVLADKGVSAPQMYAPNFADIGYKELLDIKLCLRKKIAIKASTVATKRKISNWTTLIAYYASVIS